MLPHISISAGAAASEAEVKKQKITDYTGLLFILPDLIKSCLLSNYRDLGPVYVVIRLGVERAF